VDGVHFAFDGVGGEKRRDEELRETIERRGEVVGLDVEDVCGSVGACSAIVRSRVQADVLEKK